MALGHATTPCSIVEVDDRRAKILTINLNDLHGEASPILMATLLEQLAAEVTPRELAEILPWTEEDVLARIDLGHAIPAIEERVATAEAVHRASAPVQLAFMLTPDEAKMVEATIAQATAMLTGKNLRGRGLHLICERFRQTSAE